MAEKKNRNALRSMRLLQEAFVRLLAEKPYEQITVSDVTREADLNRGTFYAHYGNMDDLLRDVMGELSSRVRELIGQSFNGSFPEDPMPVLAQIGDYLAANAELFRKLVSSTSVTPFVESLEAMIRQEVRDHVARGEADAQFDLVSSEYLVSGIFGTYRAWLAGEYGALAVAEVNRALERLIRATGRGLAQE